MATMGTLRLPRLATMCIAGAVLLYWGIGVNAGAQKLGSMTAAGPLQPRASYAVTLAFPPERFHQLRLQDKGRVVEVRDRTVYMMDVAPAAITDIAREYWVDALAPWAGR
jgi:hypothetical protein